MSQLSDESKIFFTHIFIWPKCASTRLWSKQLFFATDVRIKLLNVHLKGSWFQKFPSRFLKADPSVGWVKSLKRGWVKWIDHIDGNVEALVRPEYVAVVVVVLNNGCQDVNTLLALEHASFVACIGNQTNQEYKATKCAQFRWEGTSALVNLDAQRLAESVKLEQLLAQTETLLLLYDFSHCFYYLCCLMHHPSLGMRIPFWVLWEFRDLFL